MINTTAKQDHWWTQREWPLGEGVTCQMNHSTASWNTWLVCCRWWWPGWSHQSACERWTGFRRVRVPPLSPHTLLCHILPPHTQSCHTLPPRTLPSHSPASDILPPPHSHPRYKARWRSKSWRWNLTEEWRRKQLLQIIEMSQSGNKKGSSGTEA